MQNDTISTDVSGLTVMLRGMCHVSWESQARNARESPCTYHFLLHSRTGWDKTYCLRYLPEADFDEIHFFGDKTSTSHPITEGPGELWTWTNHKVCLKGVDVILSSSRIWRFLMFQLPGVKPFDDTYYHGISWLEMVEVCWNMLKCFAVMQIVTLRFEGGNDFEIYTHPRTIGHSHRLGAKRG